jgi:hypothetical protein
MKTWLKRIVVVLAVLFVVIQLHRPRRANPPVDPSRTIQATMPVPPHIDAIIRRACNDCHSHDTNWPWYSNLAPASWFLAHDVEEGREHLNFSEWAQYPPRDAAHLLEELCEETKKGEMPLRPYVVMHPRARLSDADKRALCEWAARFDERGGRSSR